MTALVLTMLFAACTPDPHPGTIVGNPGSNAMRVAEGDGILTLTATAMVDRLTWQDCDGTTTDVLVPDQIDLTEPNNLPFPEGSWCGLDAVFDSPLQVTGTVAGTGESVELNLAVDRVGIVTDTPISPATTALIFELGFPLWYGLEDLEPTPLGGYTLAPGDASHDALVTTMVTASSLFLDIDGDGQIDTDERDRGALSDTESPSGRSR